MAEYQLYCFAQSGNAYRAALMLNLIAADWEPLWVDFFGKGETRSPQYRATVNEMGEVPVLAHRGKKLSQSGVILTYLAERSIITLRSSTSGSRADLSSSANERPSPIFRSSLISIIRQMSSASTSPPSTRTSRFGSIASRRCRAGNIPTISCRGIRCRGGSAQAA